MDYKNKRLTWNGEKLVTRFVKDTVELMNAIPVDLVADGDICYVLEDQSEYIFLDQSWMEYSPKSYQELYDVANGLVSNIKREGNEISFYTLKGTKLGSLSISLGIDDLFLGSELEGRGDNH